LSAAPWGIPIAKAIKASTAGMGPMSVEVAVTWVSRLAITANQATTGPASSTIRLMFLCRAVAGAALILEELTS